MLVCVTGSYWEHFSSYRQGSLCGSSQREVFLLLIVFGSVCSESFIFGMDLLIASRTCALYVRGLKLNGKQLPELLTTEHLWELRGTEQWAISEQ